MEEPLRIALLEDDMEVGTAIHQWLENAGHHCHHFTSGKAIVREAARESYDLFLLDWNIPDLSGLDVLKWLRDKQISNVPVIFITARDSEADIVGALAAGADDYMIKPLRRSEMLARCAAVVRRIGSKSSEEKPFQMGDFRIDYANRIIYIAEKPVELTDKEFIRSIYKPRKKFAHKGNFGHAALLCGSYGMMGAAVLSAGACLRSGVGKLSFYIPKCGYDILQTTTPEAMCVVAGDDFLLSAAEIENSSVRRRVY